MTAVVSVDLAAGVAAFAADVVSLVVDFVHELGGGSITVPRPPPPPSADVVQILPTAASCSSSSLVLEVNPLRDGSRVMSSCVNCVMVNFEDTFGAALTAATFSFIVNDVVQTLPSPRRCTNHALDFVDNPLQSLGNRAMSSCVN